ncbi:MAG: response regulator [Bdellovibrionales bacterium]
MATLIAVELVTLLFAMRTLSSVRAFVGGEGIWSKAQKGAVLELQNYARTHDERHYLAFREYLKIPLGDHQARKEMEKPDMDMTVVTKGFLEGGVHPQDIVPMVNLIRRFHYNPYIGRAIEIWGKADDLIFKLIAISEELKAVIGHRKNVEEQQQQINRVLTKIFAIDRELTRLENQFSSTLGEGSRWLEQTLIILLFLAVVAVESTGLILTITFSRGLVRVLNELHEFALMVGGGDFSKTVQVRSADELGKLAQALNVMAADLKVLTSEKQIAEGANQVKSLFLANMSHEIRTPLNAILGFVELLKEHSLSRRDRLRFVEIIERTGHGLATIINDILDISKVEAGKLEITKSVCSLQQILNDVQAVLDLRCEEKGIRLRISRVALPDIIITDPTRYKQILLNVIGNAIKFTDQGEVTVTWEHRGSQLRCRIEDTGVGISAENIEKLFQPFSQGDLSIRKRFGGTGLGLILSRRLAQLLGGDVKLERSSPGCGSVFVVDISITEGSVEQRVSPARSSAMDGEGLSLRGRKILLVEDSVDNQLLAQHFLHKEGAKVTMVEHGQAAIEALEHGTYDVILMDMQMPVMDGYTATARLRRMGCRVPIIALTAHAMKDDLDRCLQVGCDGFLCKPYRRKDLIRAIQQNCHAG